MTRTLRWSLIVAALAAACGFAWAMHRQALGVAVAACALNQRLTGSPYPCLSVDDAGPWGYAAVPSPGLPTETIVTATAPISGIESPELLQPGAAALWQAAWAERDRVSAALGRDLPRTGIGLAVNSRIGRAQDRLHIHVDCLEHSYHRALVEHQDGITEEDWARLPVRLEGHDYWVRRVAGEDLAAINPVALLADGLPEARADMGAMTLIVAGAVFKDGTDGFYLLAHRANPARNDTANGEELLNHSCVNW